MLFRRHVGLADGARTALAGVLAHPTLELVPLKNALDQAAFLPGFGLLPAWPDAVIERVYDYHAVVAMPPGVDAPRIGQVVAVVPNHVCPVVNLFDEFLVVRDGAPVEAWPVDARGRSG